MKRFLKPKRFKFKPEQSTPTDVELEIRFQPPGADIDKSIPDLTDLLSKLYIQGAYILGQFKDYDIANTWDSFNPDSTVTNSNINSNRIHEEHRLKSLDGFDLTQENDYCAITGNLLNASLFILDSDYRTIVYATRKRDLSGKIIEDYLGIANFFAVSTNENRVRVDIENPNPDDRSRSYPLLSLYGSVSSHPVEGISPFEPEKLRFSEYGKDCYTYKYLNNPTSKTEQSASLHNLQSLPAQEYWQTVINHYLPALVDNIQLATEMLNRQNWTNTQP